MKTAVVLFASLVSAIAVAGPLTPPDQVVPVHAAKALPDTAVVSPDGSRLAFALRDDSGYGLIVVNLEDLAAKRYPLPVFPSRLVFDAAWQTLWFADGRDIWRFRLDEPQAARWRSVDTEVEGLVVAPGGAVYARLRIPLSRGQIKGAVPKGVAGAILGKLCAIPQEGEPRPLASDFVTDGTEPRLLAGGDFVFDATFPDRKGELSEREIVRLSPKGKRTRLTQVRGNCYSPGVSADGRLVAAPCDVAGKGSLHLVDIKTKRDSVVFEDGAMMAAGAPVFSPDATVIGIAFRKDAWNAYVVEAAGGTPVKVSDLPETSVLGFARAGKALVLESDGSLFLATWK